MTPAELALCTQPKPEDAAVRVEETLAEHVVEHALAVCPSEQIECAPKPTFDFGQRHAAFLGGPYGFRKIFEDVSFKWPQESHRTEVGVPDHLPTFSDAEVQVFNFIDPQRILGAWVTDAELGGVVDGHLKRLPGHERTVFVQPFVHLKLGIATWLVPADPAPHAPSG